MYKSLGIHWASSIPAFLALAFTPFPFLLYKYGPLIRARCKYSAEAQAMMKQLQGQYRHPVKVEIIEEAENTEPVELQEIEADKRDIDNNIDLEDKCKD